MDAIVLWKNAQTQIESGDLNGAYATLCAALEMQPDNPDIISERAVVIFHLGDMDRSLKELDKCVELEPKNPYRYASRAYIKANMKMLDEAIDDYEICVELDPNDPIAYNNLGLLLETKGRMTAAKRNFSKAEELESLLKDRGVGLSENEDVEEVEIESEVIDNSEVEITPENKEITDDENSWKIAKDVFTKKSVFKEYWSFVMNGFKFKEDDK